MAMKQIDAKEAKKGAYIMIDDVACKVSDMQVSKTGKHGHAKCRITAEGILDGKRRVFVVPGKDKMDSPIIEKKEGQVLSISGTTAQIMDVIDYETFEAVIPSELQGKVIEGGNVAYWIIAGTKAIMEVKS